MAQSAPVEAKVKAATTATFLVSLVLAVLNSVAADESLLDPLPGWLQVIVIALVPPGIAFLTGYQARHTSRGPSAL
ncbi:holin [Streptomyces coffeae]|uniref:Holin n=1 Tax=Streptomyces coffeae TaxID=621382 RepID=A0ABS1NJE2_9ACTN|nr:holin [Streptomyces coffeae]MBL1100156.1 holin [Streptomyces coffeae]